MKKPISALLAVSLIASMAVPAMADDNADTTTTSTTTVETPKATEEGAAEEGKEEAAKEEKAEEEAVKEEAVAEEAQDTVDGVEERVLDAETTLTVDSAAITDDTVKFTVSGTDAEKALAEIKTKGADIAIKKGSADAGLTFKANSIADDAKSITFQLSTGAFEGGTEYTFDFSGVTVDKLTIKANDIKATAPQTVTDVTFTAGAAKVGENTVKLTANPTSDLNGLTDGDLTGQITIEEKAPGKRATAPTVKSAKVDEGNGTITLTFNSNLEEANKGTFTVKFGGDAGITFNSGKSKLKTAEFTVGAKAADVQDVTVAAKTNVKNNATEVVLDNITPEGTNLTRLNLTTGQVAVTAPSGARANVAVQNVTVAQDKITLTFAQDAIKAVGKYTIAFGGADGVKFGSNQEYKLTTGSFTTEAVAPEADTLQTLTLTPNTDTLRLADATANKVLSTITTNVATDELKVKSAKVGSASEDATAKFTVADGKLKIGDAALEKDGTYTIVVFAKKGAVEKEETFTLVVEKDPTGTDLNKVELSKPADTIKVKDAVVGKVLADVTVTAVDNSAIEDATFKVTAVKSGQAVADKFEVKGGKLQLKDTLEEGKYDITVKAEKQTGADNHSATATFTLTVEADTVVPPTPPTPEKPDKPSHGGGGGGGRHEHPSTIKGDKTTSSTTTTTNKTSANVASNGEVSATDVAKQVAKEAAANTTVSVLVENAKTVSAAALKEMADAASAKGATAVLKADTVVNGVTEGRLYIDAAKGAALKADMALTVRTSSNEAKSVEKLFNKYFTNNVDVVTLSQKGKLEMNVKAAVKVDVSNMNTAALRAYYYDTTNNSYHLLPNANCTVDANGFVHFTTNMGGSIIITDSALAAK